MVRSDVTRIESSGLTDLVYPPCGGALPECGVESALPDGPGVGGTIDRVAYGTELEVNGTDHPIVEASPAVDGDRGA